MKCPLLVAAQNASGKPQSSEELACGVEDCAWWQVGDEQCAILNLTESLVDIAYWLIQIKDKMPHTGQFTR